MTPEEAEEKIGGHETSFDIIVEKKIATIKIGSGYGQGPVEAAMRKIGHYLDDSVFGDDGDAVQKFRFPIYDIDFAVEVDTRRPRP